MKTTTLCLLVSVSIAILVVAVLFQKSEKDTKQKEGFEMNLQDVSIGGAIGVGIMLLLLAGFFLFRSTSKQSTAVVVPQRGYFLNNLY